MKQADLSSSLTRRDLIKGAATLGLGAACGLVLPFGQALAAETPVKGGT